jgi:hypothetical protein
LRAALWAISGDQLKATLWASRAGQFIGYAMVALAVLGVLQGSLDFIWFGLIGWFIAMIAEASYRQQLLKVTLEGVRVSAIMSPDPVVAPGSITLDQLVEEYFLGGGTAGIRSSPPAPSSALSRSPTSSGSRATSGRRPTLPRPQTGISHGCS